MENEGKTEVEYSKAKLYKRWFSFFIDLFVMIILTFFISALASFVTTKVPAYIKVTEERETIRESSGLYKDGIIITTDDTDANMDEKKEKLRVTIDNFYTSYLDSDDTLTKAYLERKINYVGSDGKMLFDEDGKEKDYGADEYYQFYVLEIEKHCISLLSANPRYGSLTGIINRISIIELFLSGFVATFITWCLVPLFIKRGRRTLGMYLFKISLISVEALNVTGKQLWARNALIMFVGYALSTVTVLIPLIVSLTMMQFSKRGQDFFDYVTNTYIIDSSKKDVYLNYSEYLSRCGMKQEASIENKGFDLDNHTDNK